MTQPLTVKQAADRLGYHPNYVRRLLREGTIKGQRFSTIWMVEPNIEASARDKLLKDLDEHIELLRDVFNGKTGIRIPDTYKKVEL